MKKCAEKIAKNREDAAMACKTQLKQHQSKTTDKSAQSTSINHKTVQFEQELSLMKVVQKRRVDLSENH